VAPGFVDIHTHSDLSLLSDGRARSKVRQGVTTEVVGNCGLGAAPVSDGLRAAVSFIDVDQVVDWCWTDVSGYLDALEACRPALNVVALAAHVPLRVAACGFDRDADPKAVAGALSHALTAGVGGVSTGLMYPPAMFAGPEELVELARGSRSRDLLFAVHMRDYGDRLLEAVEEALDIARRTGVRLQISHLAVAGRRNWGKVAQALDLIDTARRAGVDVAIDIYPYLAGSTTLTQLLPAWAQAGTTANMLERLCQPGDQARILAAWERDLQFGWDEVEIAFAPGNDAQIGSTIGAVAAGAGRDPARVALDLIRGSEGRATIVAYGRCEEDLVAALQHDSCMLGSDGLALDPDGASGEGRPHPRSYGAFPRLLARYVRERGLLPLEQAVAMATSRPAERLGLQGRGRVRAGAFADLVVFDLERVADLATFRDPQLFPAGIEYVAVNGELVVEAGEQLRDRRPGRVLR